jgi:hypothetical protein
MGRPCCLTYGVPFEIIVHAEDRILEIRYPANPSAADIANYVAAARQAIDSFAGPWSCLVEQQALVVLPPDLAGMVAELNAYAAERGMKQSARVIASAVAALQVSRLAKDAIRVPVRTFGDRKAAIAWLKSQP